MRDRRDFVRAAVSAILGATILPRNAWALDGLEQQPKNPRRRITVYKDPECGCCKKWVELANATGWIVDVKDVDDINKIKTQLRVPKGLWSCHTAVVGRNVFEGHVPIDLMKTFMDRPRGVVGLAVPGMPVGSPGMEVPGRAADRYDVLGYFADGRTFVYASR
jgi:hypothetical protein